MSDIKRLQNFIINKEYVIMDANPKKKILIIKNRPEIELNGQAYSKKYDECATGLSDYMDSEQD